MSPTNQSTVNRTCMLPPYRFLQERKLSATWSFCQKQKRVGFVRHTHAMLIVSVHNSRQLMSFWSGTYQQWYEPGYLIFVKWCTPRWAASLTRSIPSPATISLSDTAISVRRDIKQKAVNPNVMTSSQYEHCRSSSMTSYDQDSYRAR